MTPQEKAKELISKIGKAQHFDDRAILIGISTKEIALICVGEILKMAKFWEDVCPNMRSEQQYWQAVKTSISQQ